MANAFSLFGTIGVNTNPLKQGLNEAERELKDFEGQMKSAGNASQTFGKQVDSAGPSLKRMRGNLAEVGQSAVEAGAALTASITLPLVALGGMATKSALDMENLSAGMTVAMGSAKAAADEMERLREVAKLPGLGFKEAVSGSIALQGAGLSADLARRSLQGFGNALASVGKGKADLDGVIRALGQIESKGKVSSEEINQIAERVPQIRQLMKGAFGTADTEALQKMGMSSTAFIEAIVAQLEKLPPVATTASGQLENLGDTIDQALLPLGKRITALIAPVVEMLTPAIEFLGKAFDAMPAPMQYVVIALGAIAAAIGPLLVLFGTLALSITSISGLLFQLGITSFAALTPILLAVGKVILIVGALAAVAYVAYKAYETNFLGIKDIVDSVFASVSEAFMTVIRFLDGIIAQGLAVLSAWWHDHGEDVMSAVNTIKTAVIGTFNNIKAVAIAIYLAMFNALSDFWDKHGAFIMEQLGRIWTIVKNAFAQIADFIGTVITVVSNIINGDWSKAMENLRAYGERSWERLKTIFKTAFQYIIAAIVKFATEIYAFFADALSRMYNRAKDFLSRLPGMFIDGMKAVGTALIKGVEAMLNIIPRLPEMFVNVGKAIINGIISGLKSGGSYLYNAFTSLVTSAGKDTSKAISVPLSNVGSAASSAAKEVGILEGFLNSAKAALEGIFSSSNSAADGTNNAAGGASNLANSLAGKGGKGGAKSVKDAADEAQKAIEATRMEIALYGKETRLAKFDTEVAAGAMKGWTQAQIEFQRWQLLNLDLMDNSTKAIQRNKQAMDDLVKSLEKAAEIDIKPLMPKSGAEGGPSILDRRGPIDLGPMEPPPIAPWDTFFGKVKEGMRKLKEELPSFTEGLANALVSFANGVGDVFYNAVKEWDGTWKGFWNSLKKGFADLVRELAAQMMRLLVMQALIAGFGALFPSKSGTSIPGGASGGGGAGLEFAGGGLVKGPGSATSDSIPAMLSNGEYVIPADAVRRFGVGFFESLRQGAMPFAMATPTASMAMAGSTSNYTNNNTFNISVPPGAPAGVTGNVIQREVLTALQKTQRRNR